MTSAAFFSSPPSLSLPINGSPSQPLSPFLSLPSRPPSFTTLSSRKPPSLVRATSADSTIVLHDDASGATSSSTVAMSSESEPEIEGRIGARVRVKVPLKVYHVPKVPELDLSGKIGVLKDYVAVWKGKRVSANLPFKVEFIEEIEGRPAPVKFLAHLRDDEFEYV